MSEKWLTIPEMAEVINLPPTTLRDMVTRREVPHRRLGKRKGVRFAPEDIAALKQQTFQPAITETPSRPAGRVRRAAQQSAA